MIYPNPSLVKTVATTTLGEVRRTKAPSVLFEVAYHDNPADADWIKANIKNIARNLVISLTDYFNIPFNEPANEGYSGQVTTNGGNLNLRQRPDIYAPIIGKIPNKATVQVQNRAGDWLLVSYLGKTGYVNANFIT